jgi:hypothetical protein
MGTWDDVLSPADFIPLAAAPGALVLEGPSGVLRGEHVLLYPVMIELCDLGYVGPGEGVRANEMRKALILSGLRHFWFCLGLLGGSPMWFIDVPEYAAESRRVARVALSALLGCWDAFCALDRRFASGCGLESRWSDWGRRPFDLCSEMGVPESQLAPVRIAAGEGRLGPQEAAAQIAAWVDHMGGPAGQVS